MSAPVAFYCVSDARFFLGAVALINSLRLQGHREPVYVLDLGLTDLQRELLAREATVVPGPAGTPPYLAKTVAPRLHPAETMVLIDVDMIVTRPLGELIERARAGAVVAFENNVDRFVAEWGELLDLGQLERRGRYVCSGLVAAGGGVGAEVLELLDDRQRRVDFAQSHYGSNHPAYPFLYPEQDVLNAILASDAAPGGASTYPFRLAPMPPFTDLRLLDARTLRCAYSDGEQPYVVHHFGVKPWLRRLDDGVYSQLLRRVLNGPGLALRVPRELIPSRLRDGIAGRAERGAVNLGWWIRWHVLDPLRGTTRRLRSRIPRRAAEPAGRRLLRAFADRYPAAVFVGVGANDGRSFDQIWPYVSGRDWRGVLVEPVPHIFARLRDNCRGLEGVALENSALAAEDGRLVLHHFPDVGEAERAELPGWYDAVGSTSRERVLTQAWMIPDAEERLVAVEVPALSFDSLCRKHGLERIDLLVVDVEGQDSEVIAGVDFDRHRPRVIVYEHVHLSAADREACRARLEGLGYETMEEGIDTYCLDTRVDDDLTRLWPELKPLVPGVSAAEWDSFIRSAPDEREWEAFVGSQKAGAR